MSWWTSSTTRASSKRPDLIGRKDAFAWIHMPPDEEKLAEAKRRLKYDELFLMQLGLGLRRYRTQHSASATPCTLTDEIDSRIRRRFPFLLTDDQNACIAEIAEDMSRTTPMNRLLQGDVGSGKTVRRPLRGSAGHRQQDPGRHHGADGNPRLAALPQHRAVPQGQPGPACPHHRRPHRQETRRAPRPDQAGRDGHRRRHRRPAAEGHRVPATWAWSSSTSSTSSASTSGPSCARTAPRIAWS